MRFRLEPAFRYSLKREGFVGLAGRRHDWTGRRSLGRWWVTRCRAGAIGAVPTAQSVPCRRIPCRVPTTDRGVHPPAHVERPEGGANVIGFLASDKAGTWRARPSVRTAAS